MQLSENNKNKYFGSFHCCILRAKYMCIIHYATYIYIILS